MDKYIVEVIDKKTQEPVKRLTYSTESQAERAERGVNHSLNSGGYYTQIVKEETEE